MNGQPDQALGSMKRWAGPLTVGVLAVVAMGAAGATPGPGLSGSHLAVTVSLALAAASTLALLRFEHTPAGGRWPGWPAGSGPFSRWCSTRWASSHVSHLFAKTGVRDRAQAVGHTFRHGIA